MKDGLPVKVDKYIKQQTIIKTKVSEYGVWIWKIMGYEHGLIWHSLCKKMEGKCIGLWGWFTS